MDIIILIILITVAGPLMGSLVGVMRKPSDFFIYNMLAFAAGVMLSVSFLELIPESIGVSSVWIAVAGVCLGSLVMYSADRLIPHIHPGLCRQEQGRNLRKTAAFLFAGIFLHNFPEGMAIGIGLVSGIKLSVVIAIAIAIHDIPEAICTSAPYYYCTRKRLKAFLLSFSTALPTLAGLATAYYLFAFMHNDIIGLITAGTAGLMIYISADELIPASCCRGRGLSHSTIFSLILGVVFVVLLGALGI